MNKPINLVLLYGGRSGEHEISLMSAASVLKELNPANYHIIPIGMDKEGRFYQNDYEELRTATIQLPVKTSRAKPLSSLLQEGSLAVDAEVVLPMVHGPMYEDGCLQGLLELAGVAYVGSDVLSSAIGMDKDIARRLVSDEGISCARYYSMPWHASRRQRAELCQQVVQEFGWPLFVKPCSLGSSVGIHKVKTMAELESAIEDALRYDDTILIEEAIKGREIELAVLENSNPALAPLVSVAGEIAITHPDAFYSYTVKYLESSGCDLHVPADLTAETLALLQKLSALIFTRLKCKGLARVDFFVDEEGQHIYFNEINTLPGFTAISMYPKLWQASGMAYSHLLDALITIALNHQQVKKRLITSYV